ncbi:hypothetical protein V1279_007296 [Bradyrhizobium sp. AZCC 1610]
MADFAPSVIGLAKGETRWRGMTTGLRGSQPFLLHTFVGFAL